MRLDQLITKLTQAWRVQRQQIQVIGGALLILLCLVFWERSQWTQPPPLDLLHDLPQAQPTHSSDAPSATGLPHFSKSDPSTHWTCHNSKAWFQKQSHRWRELEELTGLLCGFDAASGFQLGLSLTGMQPILDPKHNYNAAHPLSLCPSIGQYGICDIHQSNYKPA